jgi:hypothetical protein
MHVNIALEKMNAGFTSIIVVQEQRNSEIVNALKTSDDAFQKFANETTAALALSLSRSDSSITEKHENIIAQIQVRRRLT